MSESITLMQAILLGGWYWFGTLCLGYTNMFSWTPTVCGLVSGIVLGDVKTALWVAASVQPLYLAFTGGGGTVAHDPAAATIVACTVTLKTGMDPNQAVTLAVPIGLLTAHLSTIRRIWFAYPAQMADKYALNGNDKGILFMGSYFCWISKIVIYWLPMSLMLYLGTTAAGELIDSLPAWLTNALSATGGMLPSLGFAMTVNVIGRANLLPYFLAGFFFVQYANTLLQSSITAAVVDETTGEVANQVIGVGSAVPGMALALLGLFLAFIHLTVRQQGLKADAAEGSEDIQESSDAAAAEAEGRKLLTKKDVNNQWFRWWWYCEQSNSFSRLQSLAVCCSFIPILKKLYGHDQELYNEALSRQLMFFNTQGVWGSVIFGIVIAMEEQRAMGANMPIEMITGVKAGLMGPFAGIGDTIDWATMMPLLIVLFLPFIQEGQAWAPVVVSLVFMAITYAEGYYFTNLGYRLGTEAAVTILESGSVNMLIEGAGVLGLFMMGGLGASMVNVVTPITIPTAANSFSLQTDILNPILPGILSLAPIALVYRFLIRGGTMLKATFWLLGAGVILGSLGIIGAGGLIFGPEGLIH
jgi:mannose/fructose/N-acetylgalactosamine-specific phosphotransferase system component IID/mannose/fructose/N-acetylgalactosamine-specific phosphotransferase system component IIC